MMIFPMWMNMKGSGASTGPVQSFLTQEDGSFILQEDGSKILIEDLTAIRASRPSKKIKEHN